MIITNSVIKVKQKFRSKDDIKSYLYSFIGKHPFRQYNQKIADEFGEHLFSMTFIPSNLVVLTQRYPTEELYYNSLPLRNEIMSTLPHRPPFLLVDKIFELSETHVIGLKNVTMNEPFFEGHFPNNPVFPGVILIEALAQVGGILVMHSIDNPKNHIPYLAHFKNIHQ